MTSLKLIRAARHSHIGDNPASFTAMAQSIPSAVIDALSSRHIASLVDAMWAMSQRSKVLAEAAVLAEGGVYDGDRLRALS